MCLEDRSAYSKSKTRATLFGSVKRIDNAVDNHRRHTITIVADANLNLPVRPVFRRERNFTSTA